MASRKTTAQPETLPEEIEQTEEVVQPETLPDERDEIIKELRRELAEMKKAQTAWQAPTGTAAPDPAPKAQEGKPSTDPWEEWIQVTPPRHGRGQEKTYFVSVNGRNAAIPADGKPIMLRKPHALALLDSLEAEASAEEFAENLPHEAAPASFAELMSVIKDLKNKLRESGIMV